MTPNAKSATSNEARTSRRRVNVTVRKDYLDEARAAGVNLSRVLEESLAARLADERERRWLDENREAIAARNAQIDKHGLWHRGLTDWY